MQTIDKIVKLAKYYSVSQEDFETVPAPTVETIKSAKMLAKNGKCFKRIDRETFICTDSSGKEAKFNIKNKTCSCRYFLKWKTCAHLIGYDTMVYNNLNNFASKPTRGRKRDPARKTTRRTTCKTQKCLSFD